MPRPLEQLGDEIAALSTDIQAATCRWLGLLAEFDEREGWAAEGHRTCALWVGWRCGIGDEAAREYVRVARRLGDLPLIRAAFSTGALTYSKVRALTRLGDVAREAELVELARTTTAAQLERVVRGYRSVVRADEDVSQRFDDRFLDWSTEEDGTVRIRGRLTAEQGAILVKAIESTREAMRVSVSAETPDGEVETPAAPTLGARNADALTHLADTALAAAAGSTGGDRFQIVVHVDADALVATPQRDPELSRCELDDGTPLARETLRRVACDASMVRITEREGMPLAIGRKTRSIPPALRRALRNRDGCCQFPGCESTRHVDAHHLHHWVDGGPTDIANLVQLCRHHHRLIHEGGFAVSGSPGALVFTAPSGRRLRSGPSARRPACGTIASVSAETPLQPFERMNLGDTVDALLTFAPPGADSRDGREGLVMA